MKSGAYNYNTKEQIESAVISDIAAKSVHDADRFFKLLSFWAQLNFLKKERPSMYAEIEYFVKEYKIPQKAMSKLLGISRPSVTQKLKVMRLKRGETHDK